MKTAKPVARTGDDPFFGSPPPGWDRASWEKALLLFSDFFAGETSKQIDELRAYSFSPAEHIAFFHGLQSESDRAIAVLAFGYLEDQLSSALAYNFASLGKDLREELMGSMFKPLGSVSARLKVCRAFGWLSATSFDVVNALREIRNSFAHGKRAHDFSAQSVKARVERFPLAADEHLSPVLGDAPLTLRQKFLITSSAYAIYLPLEIIASKANKGLGHIEAFLWKLTLPMMGTPFDSMMNTHLYVAQQLAKSAPLDPSTYQTEERHIMAARIQRRAVEGGKLSTIAMRTWSENPTARAITLKEAKLALEQSNERKH